MSERISGEQIERMRRLAALGGHLGDVDPDPTAGPDELELVHMADVVEMQRLLELAADELERLYARDRGS